MRLRVDLSTLTEAEKKKAKLKTKVRIEEEKNKKFSAETLPHVYQKRCHGLHVPVINNLLN
jgi:hypothetical protein